MQTKALLVALIVVASLPAVRAAYAEEAASCEGMDCSGHGLCVINAGVATCQCEEGYVNEPGHQQTCVPEPREETVTAPPEVEAQPEAIQPPSFTAAPDPCAGVTCSGHGTCQTLRGAPVCSCETFYEHPQGLPIDERLQQCVPRSDAGDETEVPYTGDGSQDTGRTNERPTGFSIEVDLSMAAPIFTDLRGELISPESFWLSPHFALGGQFGRVSFALQTTISIFNELLEETDTTYPRSNDDTFLGVKLGPRIDGEVWGTRRAALFLYGGIDVLLYRYINEETYDEESDRAAYKGTGFSLDIGLGGRIYVMRQLSIGVMFGSLIDVTYWSYEEEDAPDTDDLNDRSINWSLYGALMFRFVAARDR